MRPVELERSCDIGTSSLQVRDRRCTVTTEVGLIPLQTVDDALDRAISMTQVGEAAMLASPERGRQR